MTKFKKENAGVARAGLSLSAIALFFLRRFGPQSRKNVATRTKKTIETLIGAFEEGYRDGKSG
jgi:hypothetical protein